jgi:hypothetical protein
MGTGRKIMLKLGEGGGLVFETTAGAVDPAAVSAAARALTGLGLPAHVQSEAPCRVQVACPAG